MTDIKNDSSKGFCLLTHQHNVIICAYLINWLYILVALIESFSSLYFICLKIQRAKRLNVTKWEKKETKR